MPETLIIVILDESGSMGNKKLDVLGGFNGFVEGQRKIENDTARLYLVKFNTAVNVVYKGLDLESVPTLTNETYTPGGGTALYDAIAEGVRLADKDKKAEERVICVIMTDGEENSSRETTKQQIKDIISGYEAKGDWTFLYIGENPERWTKDTGMSSLHGIQYNHAAPQASFQQVMFGCSNFRNQPMAQASNLFGTAPKAPNAFGTAPQPPLAFGTTQESNAVGTASKPPLTFGFAPQIPSMFGTASQTQGSFGMQGQTNPSQTPLAFGTASQTHFGFGTASQTPLAFGTAPQTPLAFGTASQAPNLFGTEAQAPNPFGTKRI